jgi:hypothetical protein
MGETTLNGTTNATDTTGLYPNGLRFAALGPKEIAEVISLSREIDAGDAAERAKTGAVIDFLNAPDPDADAWMALHGVELLAVDCRGATLNMGERLLIRESIADAMRAGRTDKQIARLLMERFGYSDVAATVIARTEVGLALGYGHHCGAVRVGMRVKRWLLSSDDGVCEQCAANRAQGWVDISEAFPSGALVAIDHVGCRCDVAHSRVGR